MLLGAVLGAGVRGADISPPALTADYWAALLPGDASWEESLRSGRLPLIDPETLPATAGLPDVLRRADGRLVSDRETWAARRGELLRLFERYVTGAMPPPPTATRVSEEREMAEGGIARRTLALEFGADFKARLRVELLVPPGRGPFPVFLTQANHRAWALVAVNRGYIGCIYAAADSLDDTPTFDSLWPESDATLLTRRAWAASRCVDYLRTLPWVNPQQIAIAGHSRNGKQSLIAGAFDERIAAVISSSSGAGGAVPYRLCSEVQFAEGIAVLTGRFPQWMHPRLRFFAGRENRLPIDQHELVACLAPRPCLLSTAINDCVESVWAIEQTWREARRAYALFRREDALELRYRPGSHETRAEDIEGYLDWLDGKFGRAPAAATSQPIYPTYEDWVLLSGERIDPKRFPIAASSDLLSPADGPPIRTLADWEGRKAEFRSHLTWALGEAIPASQGRAGDYGSEPEYWARMLRRDIVPRDVEKTCLNFGGYLAGDLYRPSPEARFSGKRPAIVWLHPTSVPCGYLPGYGAVGVDKRLYLDWVRAGYAVFAFDQIGTGRRVEEVQRFYNRHPHSSLLGCTVRDTEAAVDALLQMDFVDSRRIYVVGYATGGMAALHAAALDERIAGVIAIAGFTPMRTDTADKGTGGIARWTHWLPFLPRLGAFVGCENRIPYDYDEVLALIAPRLVVLVQPTLDYQSTASDLRACVARACGIYSLYGRPESLRLVEVDDYNHCFGKVAAEVVRQLQALPSAAPAPPPQSLNRRP